MKRLFSTGIFFMLILAINAQVTLDKRYEYSTSIVKLETLGYKYYVMDVPSSQCKIYNLDHSLFKTISCSVPSNFYLADVKFISENLFDNDAGIELAYTYYKYVPTQSSYYYEYDSKIINEDGSALQTIDGARYIYINQIEDNTYKLFAYCFDYSVFPEIVWTNIYDLPGTPIVSILENETPEIWMNAFPNPASQSVKVAYNLPKNVATGVLHFIDNNGRELEQFIVDNHTGHLALDVSSFKSGIYHYFIEFGNTKTPSKKLVIR
ncbi:MAG: T9SS type A sorting domain-containing protein [Draconibacterium sp.]|nr:T9SS type A sorting domain-containing protein [Draconibacterium sp.]